MKKILVFLIIFCISTFSSAHMYEHTKVNTHIDKFHSSSLSDYAHLENGHIAFDGRESHYPSIHKHLDKLCFRSARQRNDKDKLFNPQVFVTQKDFLDTSQANVFKKPKKYTQVTYYNSSFISRNQPLLI